MRSLYLFRAVDFADAHVAALRRARQDETRYSNVDGDTVVWALSHIETLDWIGDTVTDGREVYSELGPPLRVPAGELVLDPESIEPTQTGV